MDLNLLKNVALFQGLTRSQLEKIARISAERSHEASSRIFKEGDPGEAMFVIVEGNAWTEASEGSEGTMRTEEFGQVPGLLELPAARLDAELDRLVAQAFEGLSALTPADLEQPLRGYRDRGDPGPLTTESHLGE